MSTQKKLQKIFLVFDDGTVKNVKFTKDDVGYYREAHEHISMSLKDGRQKHSYEVRWSSTDKETDKEEQLIRQKGFKPLSLLERIQPIQQIQEPFKGLIYGRPGSGKTKLACEAPGPLLIDFERGSRTLKNHAHLLNVPVFKPHGFQEVTDLFFELKSGALPEVQTVILDSITMIEARRLMDNVKSEAAKTHGRSPYLPVGQDYQENGQAIKSMCLAFTELDRNIIFIAHDTEEQDAMKNIFLRPALTNKVNEFLWGLMDFFIHMSSETDAEGKVTRKLTVSESRQIQAKSRYVFESGEVINPTFKDILDARDRVAVDEVSDHKIVTVINTSAIPSAPILNLNLPTNQTETQTESETE